MAKTKESLGDAVAKIIGLIEAFDSPDRSRLLRTVSTYFGELPRSSEDTRAPGVPVSSRAVPFSKESSVSAKQFILEKRPMTDVERVACLAYYLTHHRSVDQFKTADISKMNTEAAQVRFSNAAMAVDNALKSGYLAHAGKGHKQLSAMGEQYVQALPDREAAKAVLGQRLLRRRPRTRALQSRTKQHRTPR